MRWRTEIGIGNVEFISKPEKGNVVVCGFFKKYACHIDDILNL